jgi:branched-chain amino acid transport system ATP-binding protein
MVDVNDDQLRLESISLSFGGVLALDSVSCEVKKGQIFGIIGPNGAGKTSVLNCINGFYSPQRGRIWFEGSEIQGLRPDKVAQRGISRTFQDIKLYTGLTVIENLMAARNFLFRSTWLENGVYFFGRTQREEDRNREAVQEMIEFLDLKAHANSVVGILPYGIRKRIDLGRSLVQKPRLLLLDEPMAGMNAEEKEDITRFILQVHDKENTSIVLIEHDMGVVMDITDKIMVLDFGRKLAEGTPAEVQGNSEVIAAYLGE